MSVIAVINRKGGAGKSTLATHIASYLASQGKAVMLGDVDRQQSSRLWLSLRPASQPRIDGWTIDERNFARPPAGTEHIVLDTPGGFAGVGLMKVALYADAILIPATPSLFDRSAAADSLAELRTLPRISAGRCQIACVGMRIDARTKQAKVLHDWAAQHDITHLGTLKSAQAYNTCLEQGLALFDFPPAKVAPLLEDWQSILAWLQQIIATAPPAPAIHRPVDGARSSPPPSALLRR